MAWDVLVADYGMDQYYGGPFDLEERLEALRDVGYRGLERLTAATEADALAAAAVFHRMGMTFATVRAPSTTLSIRWTAAFGRRYVWAAVSGRDHETFCRQVNAQAEACERHGVLVAVHNHMATPVESHEETVRFLDLCPRAGLILDTAHLAAVGGDPVDVVRRFGDRIVMVHFKDWLQVREEGATTRSRPPWTASLAPGARGGRLPRTRSLHLPRWGQHRVGQRCGCGRSALYRVRGPSGCRAGHAPSGSDR